MRIRLGGGVTARAAVTAVAVAWGLAGCRTGGGSGSAVPASRSPPSDRHAVRMDFREWQEMLDARRGGARAGGAQAGAGTNERGRVPLPPDASELERYVCEHSTHPGFRAIAEVPQPDMALIRCKHIGEPGRDFPTPIAEARELCARYGVELISRNTWAPGSG
jgi:hypothetical protein